jgi:long-chain fatty acid transport protein
MRQSSALIVALACLAPASAFASGFELREDSAHAQGTSYAGAAASNGDPSYLFYNPASLGGVRDWDVSVNGTGLILSSDGNFTGTTAAGTPTGGRTDPSGFISDAFVPAMAARFRLDDQMSVGISVTSPWGESTKYGGTWTGRYYAMTTRLTSVDITPVLSYQPMPQLTFAGGVVAQHLHAELTQAIDFGTLGALGGFPGAVPGGNDGFVALHGDSWSAGYVLGVMWDPRPDLTVGLSYRSGNGQTLRGSENFTFDTLGIAATINALTGAFTSGRGGAEVPTPGVMTGGARWRYDDRWTVLMGFERTGWSAFHQLLVVPDNPANPQSLTVLNWDDTWFGSLGAEYRWDHQWTFRGGFAFDEKAAPSEHVEPRIPDANRYWVSGGVSYRWNENIDVDFAVSHLFTPHSNINQSVFDTGNALRGSLVGTSNSSATLISLGVVVKHPFSISF